MARLFPLLLIVVVLYNLVAFGWTLAGHPDMQGLLNRSLPIHMVSGDNWTVSAGDLVVAFALLLLFFDMVKSTRAALRQIVGHAFSLLTFACATVEFIMLKGFATSVFFLILLMTLFDVIAGYTISALAARGEPEAPPEEEP